MKLTDRYTITRVPSNKSACGFYCKIEDKILGTYTTCEQSLMPKLINVLYTISKKKHYIPNSTSVNMELKVKSLFEYEDRVRHCVNALRKVYPKNKYMTMREYNETTKDRASYVALNLVIKQSYNEPVKIAPKKLEVFKSTISLDPEEERVLAVYKELYGERKI